MKTIRPKYFYLVRITHIIFTMLETGILAILCLSVFLSYPDGFMGDTSPSTITQVVLSIGLLLIWVILSVIAVINTALPSKIFALIELVKPFFLLIYVCTSVFFILGGTLIALRSYFIEPELDYLFPMILAFGLFLVLTVYTLVSAALPFISLRMIGKMDKYRGYERKDKKET
jgi:hypothetical protein